MTRTNIDIDDDACEAMMRKYGLRTQQDGRELGVAESGRCADEP